MKNLFSSNKNTVIAIVCITLGMMGAVGVIAITQIYIVKIGSINAMNPSRVLGLSPYTVYVVFESYDPASATVIARVHSPAADQALRTRLTVPDSLVVERQDVLFEDATIVGLSEKKKISLTDVAPGTRGSAVIQPTAEGATVLHYLLVGDPFPRP